MVLLYVEKKVNQIDPEQVWAYLIRKWTKVEHVIGEFKLSLFLK